MFQVTVHLNTTLTGTGSPGQASEGYLDTKGESAKFGTSLSETGLQAYLLSESCMARSAVREGQLDAYLQRPSYFMVSISRNDTWASGQALKEALSTHTLSPLSLSTLQGWHLLCPLTEETRPWGHAVCSRSPEPRSVRRGWPHNSFPSICLPLLGCCVLTFVCDLSKPFIFPRRKSKRNSICLFLG